MEAAAHNAQNHSEADRAAKDLRSFVEPREYYDHETSAPSQYLNENRAKTCSKCGQGMTMVGPAFKTPKQKVAKGWRRVQRLIEAEFVFTGCPCVKDRNAAALKKLNVSHVDEV